MDRRPRRLAPALQPRIRDSASRPRSISPTAATNLHPRPRRRRVRGRPPGAADGERSIRASRARVSPGARGAIDLRLGEPARPQAHGKRSIRASTVLRLSPAHGRARASAGSLSAAKHTGGRASTRPSLRVVRVAATASTQDPCEHAPVLNRVVSSRIRRAVHASPRRRGHRVRRLERTGACRADDARCFAWPGRAGEAHGSRGQRQRQEGSQSHDEDE